MTMIDFVHFFHNLYRDSKDRRMLLRHPKFLEALQLNARMITSGEVSFQMHFAV
jgi:hypothetical protein